MIKNTITSIILCVMVISCTPILNNQETPQKQETSSPTVFVQPTLITTAIPTLYLSPTVKTEIIEKITVDNINNAQPKFGLGLGGDIKLIDTLDDGTIIMVSETKICKILKNETELSDCINFPVENLPGRHGWYQSSNNVFLRFANQLDVSIAEKKMVVAFTDGSVWNVEEHKEIYKSDPSRYVSISSDGRYLAKGFIQYDTESKEQNRTVIFDLINDIDLEILGYSFCDPMFAKRVSPFSINNDRIILMNNTLARVYEIPLGGILHEFDFGKKINRAEFSPDGDFIALTSNNSIDIYRSEDYQHVFVYNTPDRLRDIVFSNDDSLFAISYGGNRIVKIWNTSDWTIKQVLTGSGSTLGFDGLKFSNDSKLIIAATPTQTNPGSEFGYYYIWSVDDGNYINKFSGSGDISKATLSSDNKYLYSVDEITFTKTSVNDGNILFEFPAKIFRVVFSPDGSVIATGNSGGTVSFWNPLNGRLIKTLGQPINTMLKDDLIRTDAIAFSANGELLASGSTDGKVRIWSYKSGDLVHTLVDNNVQAMVNLAFSPDNKYLVVYYQVLNNNYRMMIWSVKDFKKVYTENFSYFYAWQFLFSEDSQYVSIYYKPSNSYIFKIDGCDVSSDKLSSREGCMLITDDKIHKLFYDWGDLKIESCMSGGRSGTPVAVINSPDNSIAALYSGPCGMQFYNNETKELIRTIYGSYGFTWSPDQTMFVVTSGGSKLLYEINDSLN